MEYDHVIFCGIGCDNRMRRVTFAAAKESEVAARTVLKEWIWGKKTNHESEKTR